MSSSFNNEAAAAHARSVAMVETLIPASACVHARGDVAVSTMFPAEAAVVAHAVPERRREFATVRACARRALRRIGVPPAPILPDPDGAPRWPAGVVGSMTHCAGYRAAVVARSGRLRGIGIDAEPHAALPGPTRDLVLRDEERARLRALASAGPGLHWDCVLFCAKEAAYKAWFPSTGRWLDFPDVSITLHPGGTFEAYVLAPGPRGRDGIAGRWTVDRGLVVTAAAVTA